MTSAKFFEINTKKYDFIFIDGLHTAFQVSKDLYNSIKSLNPNGIIMIDNVYPHSKYEQDALDLNRNGPLTGDVWKAIYNVLDTLENICEIIYFVKDTERGNIILKFKENIDNNIEIDSTIPTINIDGWNAIPESEWNKYNYDKDFNTYFNRISSYPTIKI